MAGEKSPEIDTGDPGHNTTTRSAALREALKARRSPVPERAYSTLLVARPTPECVSGCYWGNSNQPVHAFMVDDPCPHAAAAASLLAERRCTG